MLSGNPVYAYAGAKKWAEKAAWDFVNEEEPHFELVTFCPPMVGLLHHWTYNPTY